MSACIYLNTATCRYRVKIEIGNTHRVICVGSIYTQYIQRRCVFAPRKVSVWRQSQVEHTTLMLLFFPFLNCISVFLHTCHSVATSRRYIPPASSLAAALFFKKISLFILIHKSSDCHQWVAKNEANSFWLFFSLFRLSSAQTAQQPNAIGLFFRSLVCLLLTALDEKSVAVLCVYRFITKSNLLNYYFLFFSFLNKNTHKKRDKYELIHPHKKADVIIHPTSLYRVAEKKKKKKERRFVRSSLQMDKACSASPFPRVYTHTYV